PEVPVRAGRDRQGATGRRGEREIGDGAVQGEPADPAVFGEPEVTIRPCGNSTEQVAFFHAFKDRPVPDRFAPATTAAKRSESEVDTEHESASFLKSERGEPATRGQETRGSDGLPAENSPGGGRSCWICSHGTRHSDVLPVSSYCPPIAD